MNFNKKKLRRNTVVSLASLIMACGSVSTNAMTVSRFLSMVGVPTTMIGLSASLVMDGVRDMQGHREPIGFTKLITSGLSVIASPFVGHSLNKAGKMVEEKEKQEKKQKELAKSQLAYGVAPGGYPQGNIYSNNLQYGMSNPNNFGSPQAMVYNPNMPQYNANAMSTAVPQSNAINYNAVNTVPNPYNNSMYNNNATKIK